MSVSVDKLNERLEESKCLLLKAYPWATVMDSRVIWEDGNPVTQIELTHPDLKWSVDWDSRHPHTTIVAREDHEAWRTLTGGKFLRAI